MSKNVQKLKQVSVVIAWCLLGLALVFGTMAAIDTQQTKETAAVNYRLDHLEDGNDLITVDEIKERIIKAYDIDLVGVELDRIDLEDIERLLNTEAFIRKADAYVDSRETLHIDIVQRTPLLRVIDISGNNYYLDTEGVRLPLSRHFTARVPVVSGALEPYQMGFDTTETRLRDVFEIARLARQDDFMDAWLESIYVDRDGEIALQGNVGSFEVIVGDAENLQAKMQKMKNFMRQGMPLVGWKELESINVKFDRQVITKERT